MATAPIRPLAWDPPYAMGATLKRQKKKKERKKEKKFRQTKTETICHLNTCTDRNAKTEESDSM